MDARALPTVLAGLSVAWLVAAARGAEACSVCVSATEETRQAYYGTTLLLMLIPFLLLGVLACWLRRAARAQQARLERADAPSP